MALTLYYHPLSSFCWKALTALYECGTPFTPHLVNLGEEKSRNEFYAIWPIGQFPVLREEGSGEVIPQSTIIIEYLARHQAGESPLIPADAAAALQVRRWSEFCDDYIHLQMQKIVGDSLRPEDKKDPKGVADARTLMRKAYGVLEDHLKAQGWMAGDSFTMADCAAAPALYYGDKVAAFDKSHPRLTAYFERLKQRPSFVRVLEEAKPYLHMFPYKGER